MSASLASNVTGSKCPTGSIAMVRPRSAAISGASTSIRARIDVSLSRSGERISMVNTARPGITLRELGQTLACPTAPTASGWCSIAIRCTASMIRAIPRPAFTRMSIGVDPVCASRPVSVTSSHHRPCPCVTTPMSMPSASRIGPCSICSSRNACIWRAPTSSSPCQPMRANSSPNALPAASVRA